MGIITHLGCWMAGLKMGQRRYLIILESLPQAFDAALQGCGDWYYTFSDN